MIAIRKFGWSMLVLTAFAGCAKQEPESATATPATTPSDTAPATGTPAIEAAPPTTPSTEMKPGTAATPDMPKDVLPPIEAPQPTPATKDEDTGKDDKKPEDKTAAVKLSDDEVAEIKKLSGGEAEKALKQLVCPVSGENLGSMGKPIKISAKGETFYLCCDGCSKEVKDDPAAVVAKLKK